MIVTCPNVMCTGKPEPRAWEYNGRSGISYKAEISDGTGNITMLVKDAEVYNMLEPFHHYQVAIEISQTAYDNHMATKCRIAQVQAVK